MKRNGAQRTQPARGSPVASVGPSAPPCFPTPLCRPIDISALVVSFDGSYTLDATGVSSRAGWGFTVAAPSSGFLADFCGPVVVSPFADFFIGAERATNNTAELSALTYALRWVSYFTGSCTVIIEFDSTYAANVGRRLYRAASNFALVLSARAAVDAAGAERVLQWSHIDSHTGNLLNDRADGLAKFGALGRHRSTDSTALAKVIGSFSA